MDTVLAITHFQEKQVAMLYHWTQCVLTSKRPVRSWIEATKLRGTSRVRSEVGAGLASPAPPGGFASSHTTERPLGGSGAGWE